MLTGNRAHDMAELERLAVIEDASEIRYRSAGRIDAAVAAYRTAAKYRRMAGEL